MINANARYELINANQQLIDFQMNRYMKHANEQKKAKEKKAKDADILKDKLCSDSNTEA